ncbi:MULTISPECIES: helix-turn-helix domain-containing protein [Pseudonocardia]|uniref:PucR C-terminal helix-turn-helix domain-containing protein n=2 Tax=Pseudonocardia TaxID=1847 RepID=A0A1Y2MJA8_PSEAH|nr:MULTISPECIES: helix-turn-helix domain-containing protein [Pseudonocardia]OSY35252.1 hypothetical protein BG845_06226 [Pseudonocardia autotrophica]TDN73147.1 PucR-like helix-turn-helix protein [Pseudonocardia autotrophica]BBG03869.1 hypothetical protein Pdca_50780 [Pseudonocardia autotrophica]GEC29538.1 hypothetical protein PSA01_65670 [Pseudonocardia saturnea]
MDHLFQELVDDLFHTFGTPATLLDARDRVLAFSDQPPELADPVRRRVLLVHDVDTDVSRAVVRHVNDAARRADGIVRIPAAAELGLYERIVAPLQVRGTAVAYVYLVDPGRRVAAADLAAFAASFAAVATQVELHRLARDRVRAAVGGLLSADEEERHVAADALEQSSTASLQPPVRAVVIGADRPLRDVPAGYWNRLLGHDVVWTELAGRVVALLGDGVPGRSAALAAAVTATGPASTSAAGGAAASGRGVPGLGRPVLVAGMGDVVADLIEVARSHRQAVRAWRWARSEATTERVGVWADLGAWRALLTLDPRDARDSVDPRVRRLTERESTTDLALLRRFLERDGDVAALAQDHHLHRATVDSRLRRLQDRYDLRWDDSDDRLATVLGVRLAQLERAGAGTAPVES